jgi:endonuclease-3
MAKLERQHPNADTELHYRTPYELLVATILSAQCTDERVNQVTPALFARYPNACALAMATTTELEPQIQSTGFFRAKSKSLVGMATAVVEHHQGEIPPTMDALVKLPGVGRKTANVVLGHALGVPGLPVDRHVLRVANRIGIARGDDPEVVEQQLCAALPPPKWIVTSDTLILHGRRICKPRPLCEKCAVREDCDYYRVAMGVVVAGSRARGSRVRNSGTTTEVPDLKARKTKSSGQSRSDSGSLSDVRRAAKRRGTGRGGAASAGGDKISPPAPASLAGASRRRGAPRQTK